MAGEDVLERQMSPEMGDIWNHYRFRWLTSTGQVGLPTLLLFALERIGVIRGVRCGRIIEPLLYPPVLVKLFGRLGEE